MTDYAGMHGWDSREFAERPDSDRHPRIAYAEAAGVGCDSRTHFVQVGIRGDWPDRKTLTWMEEKGFRDDYQLQITD